jgi:hypothetical protein
MRSSHATAVLVVAYVALLLATVFWFGVRDGGIERTPRAAAERLSAPTPRTDELARVETPVATPAAREVLPSAAAPAPDLEARAPEPPALADLLVHAANATPAVVERRVTTSGIIGTSFALEVDDPDVDPVRRRSLTYQGPRQPAFLEIEGHWEDADGAREVRRVLGDIEYFAWAFEVQGLLPGPITWRVDLGVSGAFGESQSLEPGRTTVYVELPRLGGLVAVVQTFARLAPSPAWHELYGSDGLLAVEPLVEGAASARPEPDDDLRLVEFRRCEPWVELLDANGGRLAGVMLELPDFELVPGIAADIAATTYSDVVHAFVAGEAVAARVVNGVPRPFAYTVARDDRAGLVFELALTAAEPVPPRRARLQLSLPGDDAPEQLELVLYGAHSRYDPPLAVHRRLVTQVVDGGRAVDLEVDLATLPLPLRAMVASAGHQPLFFDFETLLDPAQPVVLEFEPGSGGVVVGAYQNNPMDTWHFAPARGFDVGWRTSGSADGPDDSPDVPADVPADVPVQRLGPSGFAEWTSSAAVPFERASLFLGPLERNHLRPHGDVVAQFTDVAPGAVELVVRD